MADRGRAADRRRGVRLLLVALYGTFALAATGRATVQIITRYDEAPLAYLLSALAAVVYIVATAAFAVGSARGLRLAIVACSVELAGVLVVGTLSVVSPERFPDETVWSGFGAGYGYLPLLLPPAGLAWLLVNRRSG